MKRTISIKLQTDKDQGQKLASLREAYALACNQIVPSVIEHRCWNRVDLHKLVYSKIRATSQLGSQMVCNAIFSVCKAYKNRRIVKGETVPTLRFHHNRSIHFDKRTFTIREDILTLYTLQGRIKVKMRMGAFQQSYFSSGIFREAELVCRKGVWYLNLVLEVPQTIAEVPSSSVFGIDIGENVLAATSSGKLFGGEKVRHEREVYLTKRRQLQSNGTQSSKQLLKKISGKEARRMQHINHNVSKQVVKEAIAQSAGIIAMEDLTHIRQRIKAGKRIRSRLHRWAFRQLQAMIQYKAETAGLSVVYVNPAYSSQTCSVCDCLGIREGSLFKCTCGNQQHSDLNASRTICRFAEPTGSATCDVNRTYVAASR